MTSSRPTVSTTRSTASPPALHKTMTRREQASTNGSSPRLIFQPKRTHGTRFAARVTIGTSNLSARGALAWIHNALFVKMAGKPTPLANGHQNVIDLTEDTVSN